MSLSTDGTNVAEQCAPANTLRSYRPCSQTTCARAGPAPAPHVADRSPLGQLLADVKRYVPIVFAAVLLVGTNWWFFAGRGAELPRKQLSDGGEFRVIQVTYGAGEAEQHYLNRAWEPLFSMWRCLPRFLQSRVPFPDEGLSTSNHSDRVISIWWTWFDRSG